MTIIEAIALRGGGFEGRVTRDKEQCHSTFQGTITVALHEALLWDDSTETDRRVSAALRTKAVRA